MAHFALGSSSHVASSFILKQHHLAYLFFFLLANKGRPGVNKSLQLLFKSHRPESTVWYPISMNHRPRVHLACSTSYSAASSSQQQVRLLTFIVNRLILCSRTL
jgi:hypothetical protein